MSVKILPQMALVIFFFFFFFCTEKRNRIKLCHLENAGKFFATPQHESLALVKTKDTEKYRSFRQKLEKGNTPGGIIFLWKHSTGMNRSI